jgi:hypothetical protein
MAKKVDKVEYIRLSSADKQDKWKETGDRVMKGELKYSYYAIDSGTGYYYYEILKKK